MIKSPFLGIDKFGNKYSKIGDKDKEMKFFDTALEAARYYNNNEDDYDWESYYRDNQDQEFIKNKDQDKELIKKKKDKR